jgi:5'-methylthioadenosine phosphorylase
MRAADAGDLGGSGLSQLSTLTRRGTSRAHRVRRAVGPLTLGSIGGREVLFLARHGEAHSIPPHQVNYRANIQALKDAGASRSPHRHRGRHPQRVRPGALVLPHQIIDYTWGRARRFSRRRARRSRTSTSPSPTRAAARAHPRRGEACGETVADGGVYGATQGPRLETRGRNRAHGARRRGPGRHDRHARGRPRARSGLEYAAIAVVANHAAGKGDSARAISLAAIEAV